MAPLEAPTEEELSAIAIALRETMDQPRRKSEPATKTVLVDMFGIAKSGKGTTTTNVERFFRRNGYRVFCPPETAEVEEIRNESTSSPVVFQTRHVTGVLNYVLNLAESRDFHLVILNRGLIDMLYWNEQRRRRGLHPEEYARSVRQFLVEILRLDLVDAFFFFTCDPEVALAREYAKSATQKRGSNMNEKTLAEARGIYEEILHDVEADMPELPIFRVDTTYQEAKETTEGVLRLLLLHLRRRYEVP